MPGTTTRRDDQVRAAEERWLEHWVRGPSEVKLHGPQVGDPAIDFELPDHTGSLRRLSSFWSDGPAVVIFWRHYGCGCGIERAGRLRDELPEYRKAGSDVVVVGQGEPERAAAYAEAHGLDCTFLCDPEERAYRAYGITEFTVPEVLFDAPEEFWTHTREIGERFQSERREMGRPLVDNPWRRSGEFVIDRQGTIRVAYRWQYCEDFPDPRVHLTAIKQAGGPASDG